jgi:hypothetical protein
MQQLIKILNTLDHPFHRSFRSITPHFRMDYKATQRFEICSSFEDSFHAGLMLFPFYEYPRSVLFYYPQGLNRNSRELVVILDRFEQEMSNFALPKFSEYAIHDPDSIRQLVQFVQFTSIRRVSSRKPTRSETLEQSLVRSKLRDISCNSKQSLKSVLQPRIFFGIELQLRLEQRI